jgi:haloacetate dehalogenase
MSDGLIEGFERRRLPGAGTEIDALVGGSGTPLLLLHGFPQTRISWAKVSPLLMDHFTLVLPDLRGYGRSEKPDGGDNHEAYSKRTMALDQIATMGALGFERFAVAGHDRGGRVAYRLALDHPNVVRRLAVLDIVPTGDLWAGIDGQNAMQTWHNTFLAQDDLPERLIAGDPEYFLRWILRHHASKDFEFDPIAISDYVTCASDSRTIHSMCEDYRAAWSRDRVIDEADRGKRTISAPLLVLWGEHGPSANLTLNSWQAWASDVRGRCLPCGHFLPEEASVGVADAFLSFFE